MIAPRRPVMCHPARIAIGRSAHASQADFSVSCARLRPGPDRMNRPNTTADAPPPTGLLPGTLFVFGLVAWVGVSATSILRALTLERLAYWSIASVLFVAAFYFTQRAARARNALLALQSAAV